MDNLKPRGGKKKKRIQDKKVVARGKTHLILIWCNILHTQCKETHLLYV